MDCWIISLVNLIDIIGLIGQIFFVGPIGLVGFVIHNFAAATIAATATLFVAACKLAAHRVAAMLTSASKIANAAISYHYHSVSFLHVCLFVCEGEDVLVARSCKEKYVVVDCLFWLFLPW